jgi:Mg-chelatase subunit ChlD
MSATDTGVSRATRMSLAIEGARRALRTLSLGDALGVISFDYDARWVADLKQLSRSRDFDEVDQKLAGIAPDGGTDIYRALELAYRGLQQSQVRAKHVVLLTDGEQGSPAPFPTLVNAMRRADITISTIGIASKSSAATTLENIARLGQGRHSVVSTPAELPDVLAREAYAFVSQVRSLTA